MKTQTDNSVKDKNVLVVVLFFSWLKTLLWFYVFRKFRNWNYEQISFIEKSYFPKNERDKRLMNTILDFNRNRLENNH